MPPDDSGKSRGPIVSRVGGHTLVDLESETEKGTEGGEGVQETREAKP